MLVSAYIGITIFSIVFIWFYRHDLIAMRFDRLGEMFGDVNDIAIIGCIGYTLAFYFTFYSKNNWLKVLNAFAVLINLIVAFSTGSKISLVLIAISSIFLIVARFGRKRWYISASAILMLVILLVLILTIPAFETLKDRFLNMIYTFLGIQYKNQSADTSSLMRGEMFLNGISLFLRRPLFGNGVNGFRTFSSFAGWSHNHWSDSLTNYGLVGTFFYHAPLFLFFYSVRYIYRRENGRLYIALSLLLLISTISVALFNEKFFTYSVGVVLSAVTIKYFDISLNSFLKIGVEKQNENCACN